MSVFLSPGVFPKEIDLSLLPTGIGTLRPAFIGAAQKGPLNEPTLVTSAAQFIDTFGNPFPTSYLGYAVMAFLEEGSSCYVLRIGVEWAEGLNPDLDAVGIDTSGANVQGWGRIPVFHGIDHGIIEFREIGDGIGDNPQPVVIHASSLTAGAWEDSDIDPSTGATNAAITIAGSYTGCLDDVLTFAITSNPGTGLLDGAGYELVNSAGTVLSSGVLVASSAGDETSDSIDLMADFGFSFYVEITNGVPLGINDYVTITAAPDNRGLTVLVGTAAAPAGFSQTFSLTAGSYNTAALFAAMVTTLVPTEFTSLVGINGLAEFRTTDSGSWIQITGSCAACAELGVSQYVYDIPRSYLVGVNEGPYVITSSNNRVVMDAIGGVSTIRFDFSIAPATYTAAALAGLINANSTVGTIKYFDALSLTVPGGTDQIFLITTDAQKYDQLKLQASFSFLATLRFSEEIGINYPYTLHYRTFSDTRVVLPDPSISDPALPLSCTPPNQGSAACLLDSDYYQNIVGWFVAKSPGIWIDSYTLSLELYTEGVGDTAGRFKITIKDSSGVAQDLVQDVTFNPADTRFISNVVNEGSPIGGINGNSFYQWEQYPDYLNQTGETYRVPSPFINHDWAGGANGIPTDPADSTELDRAVIGNAATSTGIYAFQNPEAYDFNLLAIPGFTTGPVIAQAVQFCENRGDVLFILDPPFGLRPQQVIDWHNGMLTADLANSINTSYGALYWSWVQVADQFSSTGSNNGTIWIPPSGHICAVFARTDRVAEQWFAPAGLNRGQLFTALNVEYNPTQGERDALYGSGNAVNPIVNFIQQGITVWGQRTLQRASTALDRINVRMLLIFLKKNLTRTLRSFVFEQNDVATRSQVLNLINPFLADIAARRGLTAYKVVCDETNNTPERIDRLELWVSVFIKPTRAVEFIVLNLVILKTGANFGAQEVLAAGGIVTG